MCLTNYIDFPGFSRGFGDLWFVRLKGFIRHWRRRSLPVSPHYRCELLGGSIICYAVHCCIVLDTCIIYYAAAHCCIVLDAACPHPGATINIQVGSSLTKGGGGQTKNLGKLQAWAKYIKLYETWIPNPAVDGDNSCSVMENIGQMRNRLVSSALQVLVNKKLLRVRFTPWVFFKHLLLQFLFCCLAGWLPTTREFWELFLCSQTESTNMAPASHSFTVTPLLSGTHLAH